MSDLGKIFRKYEQNSTRVFQKSDMEYDYDWTVIGDDDPTEKGTPDRQLLNRGEGYEMLDFINQFLLVLGVEEQTCSSGKKAEHLIIGHLPGDIRQKSKIIQWLKSNWDAYN